MLEIPIRIYHKHFKKKLFNKIFMIYSVSIIISLITLSLFISYTLKNTLVQKELEFNYQVLANINSYLNQKYQFSQKVLQQLYADEDVLNDISYFLGYDSDQYLTYTLDRYSASRSSTIRKFDAYVESIFSFDPDIQDILLYSKEKEFIYYSNGHGLKQRIDRTDLLKAGNDLSKMSLDKGILKPSIYMDLRIPHENYHAFTTINDIKYIRELKTIGHLIINYNVSGIYESYAKYANDIKGYIVVLSGSGDVIYDSSNKYYGKKYPYFSLLNSKQPGLRNILYLEKKSLVCVNTLDTSGVIIAAITPEALVSSGGMLAERTNVIITVLLIACSIFLAYFSILTFSKRSKVIMQGIHKLQQGDLSSRISLSKSDDELAQIAISFNSMCDSLNNYINKVYLSEIKQKNAELTALQTQVNPHFLYNTLEVIRMRAVSTGSTDVGEMIYTLAALFKNTIRSGMFINIYEEVELCKLYLQLFKIRYQDKLTYTIDLHPELQNYYIIKFTLQPVIENYIVHGMNHDLPHNIITIQGVKHKDGILLTIRDNGVGIEKEKLERLNQNLNTSGSCSSSSIGLANVNERLKLIYGDAYGLEIASEENRGTTVHIRIPAKGKEELN